MNDNYLWQGSEMGHMPYLVTVERREIPQESHLLVLGVVIGDYLGRGDTDLHSVYHELTGLLQSLLLPSRVLWRKGVCFT